MDVADVILGMGARLVQQAASGGRVADRYLRASLSLLSHAGRWAAVENSGVVCAVSRKTPLGEVLPCRSGAIAGCVSCGRPVCLDHAFVSPEAGNAICYSCVALAQAASKDEVEPCADKETFSGPACSCKNPWKINEDCPLHGELAHSVTRRRMLSVLGLSGNPSWKRVQARYRELVKLYHPDRTKQPGNKMAEINQAFSWLKENRKQAA